MQVVCALQVAGIPTNLVMNIVGETGKELIKLLDTKSVLKIGGEIVLRIFNRYGVDSENFNSQSSVFFPPFLSFFFCQTYNPLHFCFTFNSGSSPFTIDIKCLVCSSVVSVADG